MKRLITDSPAHSSGSFGLICREFSHEVRPIEIRDRGRLKDLGPQSPCCPQIEWVESWHVPLGFQGQSSPSILPRHWRGLIAEIDCCLHATRVSLLPRRMSSHSRSRTRNPPESRSRLILSLADL
jgi:hypothetical protein